MKRFSVFAAVCGSIVSSVAVTSDAEVLYREIFPNATEPTADLGVGTAGWAVVQDLTNSGLTSSRVDDNVGAPTDALPVNSLPASGELARGFFAFGGAGADRLLFYTEEITLFTAAQRQAGSTLDTVDFHFATSGTFTGANRARLAIRISNGGVDTWFASDASAVEVVLQNQASNPFGNLSDSNFANYAVQETLTLTNDLDNWRSLTVDPGAADTAAANSFERLILGADGSAGVAGQPLPAGDITAFGLLIDQRQQGQGVRFDTFTINGTLIPEPASLGLLGIGAVLVLARRRG